MSRDPRYEEIPLSSFTPDVVGPDTPSGIVKDGANGLHSVQEERQSDEPDDGQKRLDASASDRWKNVSRMIRQKSLRLAERLGRSPEAPIGLEPGMKLEYAGAMDDIALTAALRDKNDTHATKQSKLWAAVNLEADRIVGRIARTKDQRARLQLHRGTSSVSSVTMVDSESESRPPSFVSGGGIFSQLLKLQTGHFFHGSEEDVSVMGVDGDAPPLSEAKGSPKEERVKWYRKPKHKSTGSLIQAAMEMGSIGSPASFSGNTINEPTSRGQKKRKRNRDLEVKLKVHIATLLMRQRYIMHLCRAFMQYGAPTHRLEEFMRFTANVLEIEAQFIYLPNCMVVAFDDSLSATSEVKMIRAASALHLGRLAEVHLIYKNVVHDLMAVDKAIEDLDEIMNRRPRYGVWRNIFLCGLACVCVSPWAFGARPIDMPIIFALGLLVGFMQNVLAPRSSTYSNVMEVSMALVTSFLARAFGSIKQKNGDEFLFCFSAIAQSSISVIFPGFSVLSSSLELQSHQIVPGSIRLVYTIIYSLFLGYGVTVGTTIYGLIDSYASTQTTCPVKSESVWGNPYIQQFVWVPLYILSAALMSHATLKQTPIIVFIGVTGYVANYFVAQRLGSSEGTANAVGSFTLGVLANLYSRLWHGHAVIAIIPGIWTMVSSGLASSGSILSGVEYANAVKQHSANENTATLVALQMSLAGLGWNMVQIAIGLTVGLFLAALVVYPSGKRRSGLFTL